jgi:hypothetical protein
MNRIEHLVFCHITQCWRTLPLGNRHIKVKRIAATTADAEMQTAASTGDDSRSEWNPFINL